MMTRVMRQALEDLASTDGFNLLFWYRQASMRKLCEMGFVQPHPNYAHMKRPAWIMTDAGRKALKEMEDKA